MRDPLDGLTCLDNQEGYKLHELELWLGYYATPLAIIGRKSNMYSILLSDHCNQ